MLALRHSKALAQLREGVAAEKRRKEQPIRLQGAADLHQHAWKIVDSLQRKARDDEIERAVGKRKGLLVGDDVQRHGRYMVPRTPLPDPPIGPLRRLPLPNPPR